MMKMLLTIQFQPSLIIVFSIKRGKLLPRMGDNVNPKKESSGCQFYIVQGKVYTEDELTLDINALYGGVRDC